MYGIETDAGVFLLDALLLNPHCGGSRYSEWSSNRGRFLCFFEFRTEIVLLAASHEFCGPSMKVDKVLGGRIRYHRRVIAHF